MDDIATIGDFRIHIKPEYDKKISDLLVAGTYEGGERNALPKALVRGDRVIEVGSAIGVVTMTAAKLIGQENILAFEANAHLIEDAKQNFALNELNIRVENAVLKNRVCWAGEGTSVDFHINKEYWASSLSKNSGTIETVCVPTKCFENEARKFGANVLICDIEGGEVELLELADLSGFNKLFLEFHYWAGREAANRLVRRLILDGFTIDLDNSYRNIVAFHRGLAP